MKALLTVLVLVSLVPTGWAQEKDLSRNDFYAEYRAALAKSRSFSRRITQKTRTNWGERAVEEEWTYEYQLPGKRVRYIHRLNVGGKVTRTEQIDLGETKYCKKDDGPWSISKSYCIGGSGSGGPSNIISEVFTRTKTELNRERAVLYHQYVTHKNTHSPTAATEGNSFWEEKYWIDEKGLLLRIESRRGLIDTQKPRYENVEVHEYDPKITIEAPIK